VGLRYTSLWALLLVKHSKLQERYYVYYFADYLSPKQMAQVLLEKSYKSYIKFKRLNFGG
jgi:hypothetical protein